MGKKIITKNYANLMSFIKMCEKSKIYNILKRREYSIININYVYKLYIYLKLKLNINQLL